MSLFIRLFYTFIIIFTVSGCNYGRYICFADLDISENFYKQPNREKIKQNVTRTLMEFAEKEKLKIQIKKGYLLEYELTAPEYDAENVVEYNTFRLSFMEGSSIIYVKFNDFYVFDNKYDSKNNYYSKLCETLRNNNIKYQENVRADFLPF